MHPASQSHDPLLGFMLRGYVIEALIGTYLRERRAGERFIHTAQRLGPLPFRHAADAVRRATAAA